MHGVPPHTRHPRALRHAEQAVDGIDAAGETDQQLLDRARRGDQSAIATLWSLHYPAALLAARRFARQPRDAEEMASDAFSSMLSALASGGGPTGSVRAYLLTSVRNGATSRARRSSATDVLTDDSSFLDRPVEGPRDPVAHAAQLGLVREAFATLPRRWQLVLWRTAVDHDSNISVAADMGMTPNAVAALSRRARRGMREAYLRVHLSSGGVDPQCRPFVDQLAQYAMVETAVSQEVKDHVAGCRKCSARVAELRSIDSGLSALLLPAVLALAPSASTLSTLGRVSRPVHQLRYGRYAACLGAAAAAIVVTSWVMSPTPQSLQASGETAAAGIPLTRSPAVLPPAPTGVRPTHVQSTSAAPVSSPTPTDTSWPPASPSPSAPPRPPAATLSQPSSTSPLPAASATPSSTAAPTSPDTPLQLTITGRPGDPTLTITLTAPATIGPVELTVILPTGSLLDFGDGDWATCQQSGSAVTCSAPHNASQVWTGQIHTLHRMGPSGLTIVRATVTSATDGTVTSVTQGFVWHTAPTSIDKAKR